MKSQYRDIWQKQAGNSYYIIRTSCWRIVLYTKTRNAHWNVEGPDFHDKHKFFEAQYEQLEDLVDDVAERMRSLGHFAPATMKSFLDLTHLTEKRIAEIPAKILSKIYSQIMKASSFYWGKI